jgi:hypothetical protein
MLLILQRFAAHIGAMGVAAASISSFAAKRRAADVFLTPIH